jgi:hypothetical protein
MSKATPCLTILLACATLATTRFGLLLHELVGHGATALVLGGHIRAVKLFYFAGGWVNTDLADGSPAAHLACWLGGIASELIAGATVWVAMRRRPSLGARFVRGIGAALVLHAAWYLAAGTWYGFGDGLALYAMLDDARYPVAIAAALVGALAGFAAAREVFAAIVRATPGPGWIAALGLALAANTALFAGELYLRRDPIYSGMMASERTREIGRELRSYQRARPDAAAAELDAERARLEDQHPRPFPFAPVFGALTLAAIVAGCVASLRRAAQREPVSQRLAGRAAIVGGAGLALVIAIQLACGT